MVFGLIIDASQKIKVNEKEFQGYDTYEFNYNEGQTRVTNLINLRQFLCNTLDEIILNENEKDMKYVSLNFTMRNRYF